MHFCNYKYTFVCTSVYLYNVVMCVCLNILLSVCPADFENGVSNFLPNHTKLLGAMNK